VLQLFNTAQSELLMQGSAEQHPPQSSEYQLNGPLLQLPIRIQLDTLTITPCIIESVDIYNSKQQQTVQITILPTQPYNSPKDIAFNRPTLPADGRWTDFTGGTSEDVSLYFDPHNQRLWHLMFYRRDIFRRHNISSAPQTLDELLEVAQQLNGTDFDGDGVPDYALCYNEQPFCAAPYMLMKSVLSTTYYGHNTSSIKPLILDPDTLQPLVMNAAVHATLQMLARLAAFNDPASSARCYPYDAKFCAGAPNTACTVMSRVGVADMVLPSRLESGQ
jgi:hypothetical protein